VDGKQYIGCDVHRKYSVLRVLDETGQMSGPMRVQHEGGELERLLLSMAPGSAVAVEACGHYGWIVDLIEAAGLKAHLAHPLEVKKRIAGWNKTDSLDAKGLARLLQLGALPEVWIPPGPQRDLRNLMRSRLFVKQHQAGFKCRIHGLLNQYGLKEAISDEEGVEPRDWFSVKAQHQLMKAIEALPSASREGVRQTYLALRELERTVSSLENAIEARIGSLGWMKLLRTIPGIGPILGATIWLEIGQVSRFPSAKHLASYAGLIPRTQSSGGRTWRGPTNRACNHFLKWAFVEAANVIAAHHKRKPIFETMVTPRKRQGQAPHYHFHECYFGYDVPLTEQ